MHCSKSRNPLYKTVMFLVFIQFGLSYFKGRPLYARCIQHLLNPNLLFNTSLPLLYKVFNANEQ